MNGAMSRRLCGAIMGALLALGLTATGATAAPGRPAAKLALTGAFSVQRSQMTVVGRSVRVTGVVRPYVAHQSVLLTASVGRRQLRKLRLPLRRSSGGSYGYATELVSSPVAGTVAVQFAHAHNAALGRFVTRTSFAALDPSAGSGSTGRFVQLIQERLAALHFYLPQSGVYDNATSLAVDAYHRLLHWGTSPSLDHKTVIWLLNGWGAFPIRYPKDGKHAEGNLGLQLLALIDRGQVQAIYPISSGKPSTPTILGRFSVYQKTPGYLPDGMYYSNFFYGGYAIHGYDPAPDYPASHGCMRVPIQDAISIFNWLDYGNRVDVYY